MPNDSEKARCFRYANKEGKCEKESFTKDLEECSSSIYEDTGSIVAEV